jgi:hypothetical protein
MAPAQEEQPAVKPTVLFDKLRLRARLGIVLDAGSVTLVVLLGFMLASWFLDRQLRLEVGYRAGFLLLVAGLLACLLRRHLLAPLRVRLDDDEVALAVERSEAGLRQALISAVQFERALAAGPRGGDSPALMQLVVADAKQRAARIAPAAALSGTRIRRWLLTAAGTVAAMLALVLWMPEQAALWARRNLLLADVDWPRRTSLVFADAAGGALRVPQGDDLTLRVQASGEVPDLVYLRYELDGGEAGSEPMTVTGEGLFTFTLQALLEGATVVAEGGDGLTPQLRITLIERPRLEDLQVTLVPPAYLQRQPSAVTDLSGDLRVPRGGALQIRARSTKPLQAAFATLGQAGRQDAKVEGERTVAIDVTPPTSCLLQLDVTDRDQLGCARPPRLFVRVVDDQAPSIDFKTRGIGSLITPWARIPGQVKARDDHALSKVASLMQVAGEEPQDGDSPSAAAASRPAAEFEPAPVTGLTGFEPGAAQWAQDVELDLKPLSPDANYDGPANKLKPGQLLALQFECEDNFGPGAPHAGKSEILTFRVVTREKLLEELQRRQVEQRRDLKQVIDEEILDRNELNEILSPTSDDPRAAQARVRLQAVAREQRALGKRVQGVADRYQAILEELFNNRIFEARPVQQLADAIVAPLARLAGEDFPSSAQLVLDFTGSGSPDARAAAVAAYDSILQRLQAVLAQMQDAENLATLLEGLRQVIKVEEDAIGDVQKQLKQAGQGLFDDKSKPKSDKEREKKK